jgi:ADP-ribosyl-[dinitrogen reductase] hydrolase
MKDPPEKIDRDVLNRIHGSMIGMALGDALGAFVEFRPHKYMVDNPVTTLKGGGTWGLKKGQVSFIPINVLPFSISYSTSLLLRNDFDKREIKFMRYSLYSLNEIFSQI